LGLYAGLTNSLFIGLLEIAMGLKIFQMMKKYCCPSKEDLDYLTAKNDDPQVVVYQA